MFLKLFCLFLYEIYQILGGITLFRNHNSRVLDCPEQLRNDLVIAREKLANKTPHQIQLRRYGLWYGPSAYWAWSGIGTRSTGHANGRHVFPAIATQWHGETKGEHNGAKVLGVFEQDGCRRHAFYSPIDRQQRSIVDWPLTSSPLGRVRIDSSRLSFPFRATMAAIARLNNCMTIQADLP